MKTRECLVSPSTEADFHLIGFQNCTAILFIFENLPTHGEIGE